MTSTTRGGRRDSNPLKILLLSLLAAALVLAACGDDDSTASDEGDDETPSGGTLVIGGIPDQDPDRLQRQFGLVADHLSEALGIDVVYEPVADYDASVSAFRIGDLDLVWFGGLTGVQARLQTEGAHAIVQRDIDAEFTSVFVANTDSGIEPFDDVDGLSAMAGRSFTFGSDSSTSGRLMPQFFLDQAGVSLDDFDGEAGFSGSHDATIGLVEAGTFDVGAVNSQVWDSRVAEGDVDTSKIVEVFRTPPYFDYHWVVRSDVTERFGDDIVDRITASLLALDIDDPDDAAILELFGAESFIETDDANYADIEAVGREIGRIEG
ncbi:putative selenate ABC transporter substrate-binding protein [Actinospongicola halichondriae]|uniref:putative selenate ABC transporter substrate-binding protein n=1 Tax=Actinospongicola halichondriae TaxID=3236844 RepID=UPI003D509944